MRQVRCGSYFLSKSKSPLGGVTLCISPRPYAKRRLESGAPEGLSVPPASSTIKSCGQVCRLAPGHRMLAIKMPEDPPHDVVPLLQANFSLALDEIALQDRLNVGEDQTAVDFEAVLVGFADDYVWFGERSEVRRHWCDRHNRPRRIGTHLFIGEYQTITLVMPVSCPGIEEPDDGIAGAPNVARLDGGLNSS